MYQVLVLGTGMAMGTMVCTLEYLSIEVQVMGMGTYVPGTWYSSAHMQFWSVKF